MSSPKPTLLPSPFPPDPDHLSRSPSPHREESTRPDDGAPYPDAEEPPYTDAPYIEPSSTTLLPPANFNPFFTLIEDAATGEHYHPSIHYIFADDDPILLTAASMRALGVDETKLLSDSPSEDRQDEEEEGDGIRESPLPPPLPGVTERYLVVDVGLDGQSVTDAQSLSTEWQVTSTSVRPAPSWDEEAGGEGLMLMVDGYEVSQAGKRPGQPGELRLQEARALYGGDVLTGLENIIGGFDKDLETLKRVIGEAQEQREEQLEN